MNGALKEAVQPSAHAARHAEIEVSVCDSFETASGGTDAWNRLVDASTYPNVFRRWEWVTTWWKWFGENRQLYVLRLTCGPELVGIAPLYVARTRLGSRRLAWVGAGGPTCPEYLGPIIHHDYSGAAVDAVAAHLCENDVRWDDIAFPDVPPDDVATMSLVTALGQRFPAIRRPGETCRYFRLPESYDALLKRLTRHGRQRRKRQLRRVKEEMDARLEVFSDADAIAAIFPTLVRLSASSKGEASPFLRPQYLGFHREACEQLSRVGIAGLRAALTRRAGRVPLRIRLPQEVLRLPNCIRQQCQ